MDILREYYTIHFIIPVNSLNKGLPYTKRKLNLWQMRSCVTMLLIPEVLLMIFTLCPKVILPHSTILSTGWMRSYYKHLLCNMLVKWQHSSLVFERCLVQTLVGTCAMMFHMVFLNFSMGICWNSTISGQDNFLSITLQSIIHQLGCHWCYIVRDNKSTVKYNPQTDTNNIYGKFVVFSLICCLCQITSTVRYASLQ